MNQILVSEKIYITKEMKRKRKIYKFLYTLSVITLVVLSIYYVLAEKQRNDQEGLSQEIMKQLTSSDDTTVEERKIVVALDDRVEDLEVIPIENNEQTGNNTTTQTNKITASDGKTYTTEATLNYPKLGIRYPVLSEENEELLKVSLCKYWGPKPNQIGNYCIVGHNYKSGKMFGKLAQASVGDMVTLTDLNDNSINYEIYYKYVVEPTDVSCTSQMTNGTRELTLITCTDYGKRRLVLKAREI